MYSPLDIMFFISQKTFDWIALMASVLLNGCLKYDRRFKCSCFSLCRLDEIPPV